MKLIYIAGPYSHDIRAVREGNIIRAMACAKELWGMGFAVICPHMNSAGFDDLDPMLFYEGDIEILRRCDSVVMLPGWKESRGSFAEYLAAKALNIDVLPIDKFMEKHGGIKWDSKKSLMK